MSKLREREHSEESLKPIEIQFGDVFVSTHHASKKYLITDIGEDNFCIAAQILDIDGKEALGFNGTTGRNDISTITEHWDLQRILQATMNFYKEQKPEGELYSMLRQRATKKPRILAL